MRDGARGRRSGASLPIPAQARGPAHGDPQPTGARLALLGPLARCPVLDGAAPELLAELRRLGGPPQVPDTGLALRVADVARVCGDADGAAQALSLGRVEFHEHSAEVYAELQWLRAARRARAVEAGDAERCAARRAERRKTRYVSPRSRQARDEAYSDEIEHRHEHNWNGRGCRFQDQGLLPDLEQLSNRE